MRLINKTGQPIDDILELDQKLSNALAVLAHNPKFGGNPFLSALIINKPHYLTKDITTAATNSTYFHWNPDFLRELSVKQTLITIKHEAYHIALMHCSSERAGTSIKVLWNWAVDWVVNGIIEHEHNTLKHPTENHPIWHEPFGIRITLEQFKQGMLKNLDPELIKKTVVPSDPSLYGRNAESIYREIIDFFKENKIPLKIELDVDYNPEHLDHGNKDILYHNILSAMATARSLRGTVPNEVAANIESVYDPQVDLSGYLQQFTSGKKISNNGSKKTFSIYKKRFIHQGLYFPSYYEQLARVLVLLDTSGSMNQNDLNLAASQLQSFSNKTEIIVVPTDAVPHWDDMTKLTSSSQIPSIKIVGRGGTVFKEFFEDYKAKITGKIDLIVVLTDGECDSIPQDLEPPCNILWVLTRESKTFNQPFGRTIQLDNTFDSY